MILLQQTLEPSQHHIALLLGQTVQELRVLANGIQTSPPRDWISPDHRMHSTKVSADVFRSPTRLLIELEASSLCSRNEVRPRECTGQAGEEVLHGRTYAVVQLVATSPERIFAPSMSALPRSWTRSKHTTTTLRHLRQSQTRVIRRHILKRNIAVPVIRTLLFLA